MTRQTAPSPTHRARELAGTVLAIVVVLLVLDHRLADWVGEWVATWMIVAVCAWSVIGLTVIGR